MLNFNGHLGRLYTGKQVKQEVIIRLQQQAQASALNTGFLMNHPIQVIINFHLGIQRKTLAFLWIFRHGAVTVFWRLGWNYIIRKIQDEAFHMLSAIVSIFSYIADMVRLEKFLILLRGKTHEF